jgi:hypothetical protein
VWCGKDAFVSKAASSHRVTSAGICRGELFECVCVCVCVGGGGELRSGPAVCVWLLFGHKRATTGIERSQLLVLVVRHWEVLSPTARGQSSEQLNSKMLFCGNVLRRVREG